MDGYKGESITASTGWTLRVVTLWQKPRPCGHYGFSSTICSFDGRLEYIGESLAALRGLSPLQDHLMERALPLGDAQCFGESTAAPSRRSSQIFIGTRGGVLHGRHFFPEDHDGVTLVPARNCTPMSCFQEPNQRRTAEPNVEVPVPRSSRTPRR